MNNLGEAFFSSPTDPGNVMNDWGRSDNDQRHRLVVSGSLRTADAPAGSRWQQLTGGWQLSGAITAYSALPMNPVSGLNSLQGTPGRPLANGTTSTSNFDVRAAVFIPRNAARGSDYLSINLRLNRSLRINSAHRLEVFVEAFNLTNRVNVITRNATFGPGAYPSDPLPAFNTITGVGDPRTLQLGLRYAF